MAQELSAGGEGGSASSREVSQLRAERLSIDLGSQWVTGELPEDPLGGVTGWQLDCHELSKR